MPLQWLNEYIKAILAEAILNDVSSTFAVAPQYASTVRLSRIMLYQSSKRAYMCSSSRKPSFGGFYPQKHPYALLYAPVSYTFVIFYTAQRVHCVQFCLGDFFD